MDTIPLIYLYTDHLEIWASMTPLEGTWLEGWGKAGSACSWWPVTHDWTLGRNGTVLCDHMISNYGNLANLLRTSLNWELRRKTMANTTGLWGNLQRVKTRTGLAADLDKFETRQLWLIQ
jgi:hypothetical protein